MAGIVYLTLYILTSLSFVGVISSKASARRDGSAVAPPCDPGDVFQGPGCGKCFCNAERKTICSSEVTCELSEKELLFLNIQELIRTANRVKLSLLTNLTDKSAACTPGELYRVDCNRCICLKTKSLVCEDLNCPNYDEVNKWTAVEMSGKSCAKGHKKNQNCVKCTCIGGNYTCVSVKGCIPSAAMSLLTGDSSKKSIRTCVPGESIDNPNGGSDNCSCTSTGEISCSQSGHGDTKRSSNLRSESKRRKAECFPGEIFDNQNGGPKCWCTILAQIYCPPKDGDVTQVKRLKKKTLSNSFKKKLGKDSKKNKMGKDSKKNKIGKNSNNNKQSRRRTPCPRRRKTTAPSYDDGFRYPGGKDRCTPGKRYRHACNICICGTRGRLKCTSKACLKHALPSFKNEPIERPFDKALLTNKKCTPGVLYRQGCNTCTCAAGHVIKCTSKQCLRPKDVGALFRRWSSRQPTTEPVEEPFDESFVNHTKKCTPGVIYRNNCNRCTCMKDNDLQCTTMACPNAEQVAILNRMRIRLQKDYKDD